MTWLALTAEVRAEFQQLAPTMWDAWDMWQPTRTEADRLADARNATTRRAKLAHAVGDVRKARKIESYQRAWKRRRSA